MSAECIGNLETYSLISRFYRFGSIIENSGSVNSAGATHENLSFVLRVEVDQCLGLDETGLDVIRTVHSGLLRNREKSLDLTHREVAYKQCQCCSNADSVVCTESRFLRNHPSVLNYIVDRIFREIMLASGNFLTNHVLVALQCDCRNIFLAF